MAYEKTPTKPVSSTPTIVGPFIRGANNCKKEKKKINTEKKEVKYLVVDTALVVLQDCNDDARRISFCTFRPG